MSLLKNIFGKKDEPIKTYNDFWNWFQKNEKAFFDVVKRTDFLLQEAKQQDKDKNRINIF